MTGTRLHAQKRGPPNSQLHMRIPAPTPGMVPLPSDGTKEVTSKAERIRLGREMNHIELTSLDDTENVVCGVDYEDRMNILVAANAVVARLEAKGADDPQLHADYVAYVGLAMLLELARNTQARWGDGSLGAARPPAPHGPTRNNVRLRNLPRRAREARQPDNLLLNLVKGDQVLPQYHDLNFPIEIRNAKAELYRRWSAKGIFVPSSQLTAAVADELTRRWDHSGASDEAEQIRIKAAKGQTLVVPGIKTPVTSKAVPAVLEYYGLARPARTAARNGYYVKSWYLRKVVDMWDHHRIIRLADLTWMEGRYLFKGQPVHVEKGYREGP